MLISQPPPVSAGLALFLAEIARACGTAADLFTQGRTPEALALLQPLDNRWTLETGKEAARAGTLPSALTSPVLTMIIVDLEAGHSTFMGIAGLFYLDQALRGYSETLLSLAVPCMPPGDTFDYELLIRHSYRPAPEEGDGCMMPHTRVTLRDTRTGGDVETWDGEESEIVLHGQTPEGALTRAYELAFC